MLITEVKKACRNEIKTLQADFHHLATQVEDIQEDLQAAKLTIHRVQSKQVDDRFILRDMQRKLEDLDNCNRRNNIRVHGLLETKRPKDLRSVLQTIFNTLLGVPTPTHTELDRAHRALKSKGSPSNPRNVTCRVHSYTLKEDIMRKARVTKPILYEDTPVQIFPALSRITLQKRRLLQPLLHTLQENYITYRWDFSFSLSATHNGKTMVPQVPEDLRMFCEILEIPTPELPGWDIILPPSPPTIWQKNLPAKADTPI